MFGHYLQNWQSQWLCFYYLFEEHIKAPIKVRYSLLPETLQTGNNHITQCRFSDALYFFNTFRKFEVKGMTNLQDFFYSKTLSWQNTPVDRVFIYSHLVAVVDPLKFSVDPNSGHKTIQRAILEQRLDIVSHPGDVIGIAGFFLNNTLLDIKA